MATDYDQDRESMWDDFEISKEFLEEKPGQIYIRKKLQRFLLVHRGGGSKEFTVGFFTEDDMYKKEPLGWVAVPTEFFSQKSLREPNHPMRFHLKIKDGLVWWGRLIVCYMPTEFRKEKVLKPKAELRQRREAGIPGMAKQMAEAAGNPVHTSELTTTKRRVPRRRAGSA